MFGWLGTDTMREIVREAVEEVVVNEEAALRKRMKDFKGVEALQQRVLKLKEDVEALEIEKDRKQETFDRRERELEHKIGLEKKRQEFEVKQARSETELSIRQENLSADRQRFEDQMEFHEERFKEEVAYLKEMVGRVLKRLPSAEIIAKVGG